MNQIITAVSKHLGPKLSAVLAAGTTAVGQITAALGASGGELDITDILINAGQSDLVSFLPAPVAGLLAYFLRSSGPETRPSNVVRNPLTAPAASLETQTIMAEFKHKSSKVETIQNDLNKLIDKFESLDATVLEMDNEMSSIDATHDSILARLIALEGTTQAQVEALPLNLRQNNPGNIESTIPGKNRWKGELDSTNRYAVFESPAYGVRAMMYLLRKVYFERHGLVSIESIIHRWAPLGDNSPESVANYIDHVAKDLHIQSVAKLSMNDEQLVTMLKSMAEFEGGRPLPYGKDVYTQALELLK